MGELRQFGGNELDLSLSPSWPAARKIPSLNHLEDKHAGVELLEAPAAPLNLPFLGAILSSISTVLVIHILSFLFPLIWASNATVSYFQKWRFPRIPQSSRIQFFFSSLVSVSVVTVNVKALKQFWLS